MSLPEPMPGPLLPELAGMRRPKWRPDAPALWRGRDCVQFAEDVVVDRVTPEHLTWLSSLDGLRLADEIEDNLPLPVAEAGRLLRALAAAGGLEDAARMPASMRWVAPDDRDAALRRFGAAVRTYRGADLASIAVDRRDRARVAVVGSGGLRDRVSPALADAGLRESEVADATVVILADAQHPDVPAFFDHDVQDLPHLNVALLGAVATVGPLVVPGRTSCLRCAHLHRRDADPAWPLLAVQWSQAVKAMPYPPIDPLLAAVAAGHAALMVRAWADAPEDPGTWADVAVTIRLPGGDVTRIPRPVHPLCGCRWPGDARSAAGRPDHPDATG